MPEEWQRADFRAAMSATRNKDAPKERTECIWIKSSSSALIESTQKTLEFV